VSGVKSKIDLGARPKCSNDGCNNNRDFMGTYRKDGTPHFRKVCKVCHNKNVAEKRGCKNILEVMTINAGFANQKDYLDSQASKRGFKNHADYAKKMNEENAIKKGFNSHTDYTNSKHPYRAYRKEYCENVDGRLGFRCTTTITSKAVLQVDHINGMANDNTPENLQTLCACCHIHKTHAEKDYKTPGRKALNIKY